MAKQLAPAEATTAPDPNERDKAAISRAHGRLLKRHNRVKVAVSGSGADVSLSAPHSDAIGHSSQLLDTFGTTSVDFMNAALSQLLNSVADRGHDSPNAVAVNAALAIMASAEPANEIEALIASQMASTHSLAMLMLGRARRVERLDQLEAQGGLAIKLLRTFTLQAEALAKLKRGGGQTVRVEHVHVHAGGQAIVGNVAPGGGAGMKNEDQPHAKQNAAADAPVEPMRRADSTRGGVPVASNV